jgi:hypothetical protein
MIISLAAGVLIGTVAARPAVAPQPQAAGPVVGPAVNPVVEPAADQATALASFKALAFDIGRAEDQDDRRGRIRLGTQLRETLSAETIGAVYLEKQRLESALAAARVRDNHHAMQLFSRELRTLCGTATVQAYLEFCR